MNWAQVVGSLVAEALVLGTFWGLFWLKKRRREERKERPPQREKLLRPAGYSAMCRIDALSEKWMSAAAQAVGAGLFFGMIGGTFYPLFAGLALGRFTVREVWSAPRSDVIIVAALAGLIALLWAVRAFQEVWRLADDLRNWRFGLRGEQAVAESLAERGVAEAGYVAFHDVPGEGEWNIDHVVVGPGGVFVLETKARPRRKATRPQEEQKVFFDGKVLEFPWCYDRKAAEQVERNADWVQEFLEGFGPKDLVVQRVIVVPGWWVESKGNYLVKAMNAKYLVGYLKGVRRMFSPEQLETTIRRLDERCRLVEVLGDSVGDVPESRGRLSGKSARGGPLRPSRRLLAIADNLRVWLLG